MTLEDKIKSVRVIREQPSPSLGIKRVIELETNPHAPAWIWEVALDDGISYIPKDGEAFCSQEDALLDLAKFLIFLARNFPE